MTYICEACGFIFCREGKVMECPSCEKKNIRAPSDEEVQKLELLLKQEKQ